MLMEPWDGPAAIAFTDGRILGAVLDRNGLRPARYYVTRDDRIILSSEVGTIDVEPENILRAGCLGPGEMLEVDPAQGRVIWNDEIRDKYANEKPYRDWLGDETLTVHDLAEPDAAEPPAEPDAGLPLTERHGQARLPLRRRRRARAPHGHRARYRSPRWASTRRSPVLSKKTRSFFDYFYQLFAQVTNPPIDALREHSSPRRCSTSATTATSSRTPATPAARAPAKARCSPTTSSSRICAIDRVGFDPALPCHLPPRCRRGRA